MKKNLWFVLVLAFILVGTGVFAVTRTNPKTAETIEELQEILDKPRATDEKIYDEIRQLRNNMTPEKFDVQRDRMARLIVKEAHSMMKLPMKVSGGYLINMWYNANKNVFVYDYNIDNSLAGLKRVATPAMLKKMKQDMIADMYRKQAKTGGPGNMVKVLDIDTYFQYHSSKGDFAFRIIITAEEQPG